MPIFRGFLLLCLVCSTAKAATIFQSGRPAAERRPMNALKSDDKAGVFIPENIAQWLAAPFSITNEETIQAISFEGFFVFPYPPAVDEFEVRFYQGGGGLPGEAIGGVLGSAFLSRIDTGIFDEDSPIYRFELDLDSPLSLEAGDYWISIVHTSTYEDFSFYWTYIDQNTPIAFSNSGPDGPYHSSGASLFFTLENTRFVPEPSTLSFAASASVFLLRRKRQCG